MPKAFYTDHDIEDLVKKGVRSLVLDNGVVLTDLAREKARSLGVELIREPDYLPDPQERPDIHKLSPPSTSNPEGELSDQGTLKEVSPSHKGENSGNEMHEKIRKAVMARLGDSVDPKLIDTIIRRVLQNVSAD